ncbi:MAG: hypothetical protein ACR2QG_11350 [Gammaproteobacteria bacterium]
MKESTQTMTFPVKAVPFKTILFGVILTVGFAASPLDQATANTGMQTIANVPAGDGESCPRNPGEKAGHEQSLQEQPLNEPPLLVIPMQRPSPLQPAVYIEVYSPALDEGSEDNVIRYRI